MHHGTDCCLVCFTIECVGSASYGLTCRPIAVVLGQEPGQAVLQGPQLQQWRQ